MDQRTGRFGVFFTCSNFPKCRATLSGRKAKEMKDALAEKRKKVMSGLKKRRQAEAEEATLVTEARKWI